jgi:hypothetical protein
VSLPAIVILIVLFAAFGLVAAITANLVRSAIHVGKAAKQFFDEAAPFIAELQKEGELAADRAAKLSEKAAALRS